MPITVTRQEEYDCEFDGCTATRTESSSVAGSYCSEECAARARGRKLLNILEHDHRFCWSCWRERKEIERPTAEARRGLGPVTDDALVGYEHHTEHVELGPYGLECACGAIDHDLDGWDQRETAPYHWYLKHIAETTQAEGQHDYDFDLETFADWYYQSEDLELALGAALDDGPTPD